MNVLALFEPIRTFVFDVDGVLTDGSLLVTEEGDLLRTMNIRDGYAIQLAVKKGYNMWVISGGTSQGVVSRLQRLGVEEVYTGIENKCLVLEKLVQERGLSYEHILYMGDDMPDRGAMLTCALPCCPADATTEIKEVSRYISPVKGGRGCVRDVIEKVLKLNGHWE